MSASNGFGSGSALDPWLARAVFRRSWRVWTESRKAFVALTLGAVFLPDFFSEFYLGRAADAVAKLTGVLRESPSAQNLGWGGLELAVVEGGKFFISYGIVLLILLTVALAALLGVMRETLRVESGASPRTARVIFREGLGLAFPRGLLIAALLWVLSFVVSVMVPAAHFLMPLGLMAFAILASDGRSTWRAVGASYSLRYARYSLYGSLSTGLGCLALGLATLLLLGAVGDGIMFLSVWTADREWFVAGLPAGAGYWFGAFFGGASQALILMWSATMFASLFHLSRRMAVA